MILNEKVKSILRVEQKRKELIKGLVWWNDRHIKLLNDFLKTNNKDYLKKYIEEKEFKKEVI